MKRTLLVALLFPLAPLVAQQCVYGTGTEHTAGYVTYLTNLNGDLPKPLLSCSGPGGNSAPGTLLPYADAPQTGTCAQPQNIGTGNCGQVAFCGEPTSGVQPGGKGVCGYDGSTASPTWGSSFEYVSEPSDPGTRYYDAEFFAVTDTIVVSQWSACFQIFGFSVCKSLFATAPGTSTLPGQYKMGCNNHLQLIQTFECGPGQRFDCNSGCCCSIAEGSSCGNGGTYDCNFNCVGGGSGGSKTVGEECQSQEDCMDGLKCDFEDGTCTDQTLTECESGYGGAACDVDCWSANDCSAYFGVCAECIDGYCDGQGPDPIIIDLTGDGFQMTSAPNGVLFDFYGTGQPVQMAWPAKQAQNGWLVLDRNGDGKITTGLELFGTVTDQPGVSPNRNGFLALALFDERSNGGNEDGWIDQKDAIFGKLRVWVDMNHDGVSQPNELQTMDEAGITGISLHFIESKVVDKSGNAFRYRAQIRLKSVSGKDHWAYDVFPVMAPPAGTSSTASKRSAKVIKNPTRNSLQSVGAPVKPL